MNRSPWSAPGSLAALGYAEDELARFRREAKRALRSRLRELRLALPPAAVAARSRAATERVLALHAVAGARAIALYAAIGARHELDLEALDAALRARGVAVYYPFLEPLGERQRTGFRLTRTRGELAVRGQRFAEPLPDAPEAAPGALDAVIVPALGVAPDGHRLGHGAGYYDVTLPEHCPPAVAVVVAFEFQLLVEVPVEAHDIAADWVVTDARTLEARAAAAAAPVAATATATGAAGPRPGAPLVVRRGR